MVTSNLRINQLSPEAYRWYLAYLTALDTLDIDAYTAFITDDCSVQSNNNTPMRGKEAIREQLGNYWEAFAGLEHDLLNIYGTDKNFVLEAGNIYTRHDGKVVTVLAVAFTDRNDEGKVSGVRFYTDVSPVFAP